MINIKNANKSLVLIALYNGARQQGMGFMQKDPPISETEAAKLIEDHGGRFDYLNGRVMKVNLNGDALDPRLYDRDNGQGAAAYALADVPGVGVE